jgi:hypothetical protein
LVTNSRRTSLIWVICQGIHGSSPNGPAPGESGTYALKLHCYPCPEAVPPSSTDPHRPPLPTATGSASLLGDRRGRRQNIGPNGNQPLPSVGADLHLGVESGCLPHEPPSLPCAAACALPTGGPPPSAKEPVSARPSGGAPDHRSDPGPTAAAIPSAPVLGVGQGTPSAFVSHC